jgi:hypothetical protein
VDLCQPSEIIEELSIVKRKEIRRADFVPNRAVCECRGRRSAEELREKRCAKAKETSWLQSAGACVSGGSGSSEI